MTDRNYSMVEYFKRRAEPFEAKYRFKGTGPAEFESWKQHLLPELKEALGPLPDPVPLNPEIVWETREEGLIKRRVLLDFEEHMSAPALIYIPEAARDKPAPILFDIFKGKLAVDHLEQNWVFSSLSIRKC